MKKRLVLTSLVAVGCACPIFAARGESFPTDGYMLEDKTYDNAATYANMGVYDGGVTATAEYEDTLYQIAAGTYLPAGSEWEEQCPANSYCPGITNATYDESKDQGVWSCPDGYPNADAGSSTDTQCYTACTVDSANIANATAVSGNDYFGAGVDTCIATACKNGYHVEGDTIEVIEQTPLIDVDYSMPPNGWGYINADGSSKNSYADTYGMTENNTWAVGYDDGAVVYGRASCQATLHDPGFEYILANEEAVWNGEMSLDQFRSELTPLVGAAKANYYADAVAGIVSEDEFNKAYSVVFGTAKDASFRTTDEGQYCYCQMTGFRGSDSSSVVNIASAPWVFITDHESADICASSCAHLCMQLMSMEFDDSFRGAAYGALDFAVGGICEANEITINWTGATADAIAETNAGMCTYDGEIRTPKSAEIIPGKTFIGWKFDKPAQE